ncbi:MAG: hypothetical protein ACUVTX_12235 [Bacteroidales bacterium]
MSTKKLADEIHASFLGILQPVAFRGRPRTDYLRIDNSMAPVYRAFYSTVLKKLNEPVYSELSKCVVDFENIFDGDEYIYIDEMHVSPQVNSIAAIMIYNIILKYNKSLISQ